MWQRHKVRKCYWKKGGSRLVQHRVATYVQKVKNLFVKCRKAKCNKMKYACNILRHQVLKLCRKQIKWIYHSSFTSSKVRIIKVKRNRWLSPFFLLRALFLQPTFLLSGNLVLRCEAISEKVYYMGII